MTNHPNRSKARPSGAQLLAYATPYTARLTCRHDQRGNPHHCCGIYARGADEPFCATKEYGHVVRAALAAGAELVEALHVEYDVAYQR